MIRVYAAGREVGISEKAVARFWSKVDKSGDCWIWMGCFFRDGYGQFQEHGNTLRASRVSWAIAHGEIHTDLLVCHKCDNPKCVRIEHLFLGTHVANMMDMRAKGRSATADRNAMRLYPEIVHRGESHGNSILTDGEVLRIRQERESNKKTYKELCALFNRKKSTIAAICSRRYWSHI